MAKSGIIGMNMEKKIKKRVGFDLDGVLADHEENKEKTGGNKKIYYGELSLTAGVIKGAKETVEELAKDCELFVISRRVPENREFARKWLEEHFDFPPENVFFVDKDEEKAEIIKKMGIGFFIDDRTEVLNAIKEPTKKFLFEEEKGFDEFLKMVKNG